MSPRRIGCQLFGPPPLGAAIRAQKFLKRPRPNGRISADYRPTSGTRGWCLKALAVIGAGRPILDRAAAPARSSIPTSRRFPRLPLQTSGDPRRAGHRGQRSSSTLVHPSGKSCPSVRGRAIALLLAALALASCGGNDKKDAERTVREFVKATSQRDADKYCEELVTQAFLEETTLATGPRAQNACKRELKALKGVSIRLLDIKKTKVHGDRASVVAVLEARGHPHSQLLRLRKEGGNWRIAGASGE
jgi:hypothetical protein